MSLNAIAKKFDTLIKVIDSERQRDLMLISLDAKAMVADRVQNEGLDSNSTALPKYSDAGVPAYLLYNKLKPGGSKIGDDYKKIGAKYGGIVSHKDVRQNYGLPTNKTTLTYTGEMWRDIGPVVTNKTKDTVTVQIKGLTSDSQDKLEWNTARYGDFLALTNEEQGIIRASAFERRTKQIKKIFK